MRRNDLLLMVIVVSAVLLFAAGAACIFMGDHETESEKAVPNSMPEYTRTVILSYDSNGITEKTVTMMVTEDSVVSIKENIFPSSEFVFGGWNTSSDGTGISYAAGDRLTLSSDLYLYAVWLV